MRDYKKTNIPLARKLRQNMTPWERKLWYEFLREYPVRFQRQKAIGNYIVDFFCASRDLVIELDGGGHYYEEQRIADAKRTASLEAMGLRVLRICNLDVDRNFRGVCEFIDNEVRKSLPQSAKPTAPSQRGPWCEASTEHNMLMKTNKRIFALGFFDGVHLGHQALLRQCVTLAKEQNCQPAAITFDRHPQALYLDTPPALISTETDRQLLLRQYGMGPIYTFPVKTEVMSTPWEAFLEQLLEYGAAGFVCGDDFRFGFRGAGNSEKLKKFCEERGLPCVIVPEQTLDGVRISSTYIRRQIESGDMATAVKFLGHPLFLTGEVVAGRQLGRKLGIPTANLRLPAGLAVPKFGVYVCRALVDGTHYPAVTNIGTRPTVAGENVTVESWIRDYEGDLYGREITLEFHYFLRPEEKFADLEGLKRQIHADAEAARKHLQETLT